MWYKQPACQRHFRYNESKFLGVPVRFLEKRHV